MERCGRVTFTKEKKSESDGEHKVHTPLRKSMPIFIRKPIQALLMSSSATVIFRNTSRNRVTPRKKRKQKDPFVEF